MFKKYYQMPLSDALEKLPSFVLYELLKGNQAFALAAIRAKSNKKGA